MNTKPFWDDLDYHLDLNFYAGHNRDAKKNDIIDWLRENIDSDDYLIAPWGAWFRHEDQAVLFRLTWG